MKVLVTGANGFIGSSLIESLSAGPGFEVIGMVRSEHTFSESLDIEIRTGDLSSESDLKINLKDVDVIIHTAGKAHVISSGALRDIDSFYLVNTQGTLNLAKRAVEHGVKRFIFLSSIKANGDRTAKDKPITPTTPERPTDPYGVSKLQAEKGLREIASRGQLEVTIIRPPLVYGAGVKGNFASLFKLLHSRIPLPLGSVTKNRRSLVGLGNLLSLITACIEHPRAANRTFLVSDGRDLSTSQLISRLGSSLGKPAFLFPCSVGILKLMAKIFRIEDKMDKLLGNLQVDISETCELLDWKPPISIDDGLAATCRAEEG